MPRLLLPLLLVACAHVPRFPGPPGVLGRLPRPAPVLEAPAEAPASTTTKTEADPVRPQSRRPMRPKIAPEEPEAKSEVEASPLALRIARAAERYLRTPPPSEWRNDCSGFVCAVLDRAGVATSGSTATLWERAEDAGAVHDRELPLPGDLAFFDDTWDRNGNGRVDDTLTHLGVVVQVDDDGTVAMAHVSSSKGRTTLYFNPLRPDVHQDDSGKVLNTYLRRRTRSDGPKVRYLAGELLRGFATVRAEDLDVWSE